ncbi:MAG TPA: DUF3455 domain-containing protein [Polyangiaceae bacterium]|nr:DUF3455 domain-containing protein [Polyangiaceae bacterium]
MPISPSGPSAPLVVPSVPDEIKVPGDATLIQRTNARGVQIYTCVPKPAAPGQFEWALKAPEASLTDDAGKVLGKHYAGPTWESTDGSKVVGAMKAKVDSPSPTAIPWLLIEAQSNAGEGAFSRIAFVQRVNTEGGKAPAQGCDKAHEKSEARVDYTATYYFYARSKP